MFNQEQENKIKEIVIQVFGEMPTALILQERFVRKVIKPRHIDGKIIKTISLQKLVKFWRWESLNPPEVGPLPEPTTISGFISSFASKVFKPLDVRAYHVFDESQAFADHLLIWREAYDKIVTNPYSKTPYVGAWVAFPELTIPSSGWDVTNKTEDKTLDADVNDALVLGDVLGTLIDELKDAGILSS